MRMHWMAGVAALVACGMSAGMGAQATDPGASAAVAQSTPGIARPETADSSVNGAGGTDTHTLRDKLFVHNAAEGGLAEIQLGQLAAQKGSNDAVRQFGQRMVDDHTRLNEMMAPIAKSLGVQTPKKLERADQATYDRLSALSGTDFDKAYLAEMTKDHLKDLHDFEAESQATQDATLKEAVERGTRMITRHTRMVQKLDAENGVPPGKPVE